LNVQRCPWCAARGELVHVHGHAQCPRCGNNVEPCCSGANAADEATATTATVAGPEPHLFPALFAERLGGAGATVTTDALLFALTQRLSTELDDARLVLEAAERLGVVERVGDSLHRLRRG
jgi:uncharacterized paraquat-inducible protein A